MHRIKQSTHIMSSTALNYAQTQLINNIKLLQAAQETNLIDYANASDENARNRIMVKLKENEVLRANLFKSVGDTNFVAATAAISAENAAANTATLLTFAEQRLAEAKDQIDAAQRDYDGKKRMIEINTYYGKRFMAQAGVMKIFIYMCIPVLIFAVLANMGLLPSYIAGFIIIAITVIGIIYIYAAVHDINRRDEMNFDEYKWEFDPSRVGTIVNPNYDDSNGSNGKFKVGCYNGACCGSGSRWNSQYNQCDASNSPAAGGAFVANSYISQPSSLLGDLRN